jgi:hypothetical protein
MASTNEPSKRCEACGAPRDGEHPHLCEYCAANIDRWTKEAKENRDPSPEE